MNKTELTLFNLGESLDNIANVDPRGYGVCRVLYKSSREFISGASFVPWQDTRQRAKIARINPTKIRFIIPLYLLSQRLP